MSMSTPATLRLPLLTSLLLILFAIDSSATTHTVSTPADSGPGSLRDLIATAVAGDTITFGRATDTIPIVLQSTITIDVNLVLLGTNPVATVIDGERSVRIFEVGNGVNLRLHSLRLTRGMSDEDGGAIHANGSALAIVGSLLDSNEAGRNGGALYLREGSLTLEGTRLLDNSALGDSATMGGGAIYNESGVVEVSGNTMIRGNMASGTFGSGGGIFNAGAGRLEITSSTILRNRANRAGGGIESSSTLQTGVTLRDVTLDTNRAAMNPGNGGGLHISGDGGTTIVSSRIRGNSALSEGGGLWNGTGTMLVDSSRVIGNVASGTGSDNGGGGIFNAAGTLTVSGGSLLESNRADGISGSGGGILSDEGRVTVKSSFVRLNTARRAGGGVELNGTSESSVSLDSATIEGNIAGDNPGNGGGLHVTGSGSAVIFGGMIRANIARSEGGGLWNGSGQMTIYRVIISENVARGSEPGSGGGGIFNNGGRVDLSVDVVIRENRADSGDGGGILNGPGGFLVGQDMRIARNFAHRAGGGIEDASGVGPALLLSRVAIDSNTTGPAPGNGGALHVSGVGNVRLVESSVKHNTAASEGGGLWNGGGPMEVTLSEIVGNRASGNAPDQGGGGIYNFRGQLQVRDSRISDNIADGTSGSGGGILNDSGAILTITNSSIARNSAVRAGGGIEENSRIARVSILEGVALDSNSARSNPGNGGALHVSGNGGIAISGSRISANFASSEGGGLWNGTGEMSLDSVVIEGNEAAGDEADQGGGGLFNQRGTVRLLKDVVIADNHATGASGSGGGILNDSAGTLVIERSTISENSAVRAGGGIEDNSRAGTPVTLTNVTMVRNSAGPNPGNGGALHVTGNGNVTIEFGLIGENSAGREGGGLWNGRGEMSVVRSTIDRNSAGGTASDDGGGGVFNDGGRVIIDRSTLSRNEANGSSALGGGLHVNGGSAEINRSTISGNSAAGSGGGIATTGGLTLSKSTVTANMTAGVAGGLIATLSTLPVTTNNSIIAANSSAGDSPDLSATGGMISSGGYNLVGVDNGTAFAGTQNDIVGNGTPIDPLLDPLADNGDLTLTHALRCGSPAVNAGDPGDNVFDQRGRPVFGNRRDIGSFELEIDCGTGSVTRSDAGTNLARVTPSVVTEGRVTVEIPETFRGEIEMQILDMEGRRALLLSIPMPGTHEIDLADLPAGSYLLLLTNDRRSESHRLVLLE